MQKDKPIVISEQKLRKLISILIAVIVLAIVELCVILFLVIYPAINNTLKFEMIGAQEEVSTSSITFDKLFDSSSIYTQKLPEILGTQRSIDFSILEKDSYLADDEDFRYLAATIYLEASPVATLEDAVAVGFVIDNRLKSSNIWHCETYKDVVTMTEPAVQFAVTLLDDYDDIVNNILEIDSKRAHIAVEAARIVISGNNIIDMPEYIQFFYGDGDRRVWDNKTYYYTYGGNSFFYNDLTYKACSK